LQLEFLIDGLLFIDRPEHQDSKVGNLAILDMTTILLWYIRSYFEGFAEVFRSKTDVVGCSTQYGYTAFAMTTSQEWFKLPHLLVILKDGWIPEG
jgi:hypothetical protein